MSTRIKGFGFRRGQDFFRRHSRHGAKAGFKVQRLSQGSGTFCKQSLHLGIVLGSKRVKVRKGTTALLAKPRFPLSYNLSLSWQALIFGEIKLFCRQRFFAPFFVPTVGLKTICPPTADGGAKAGFKVQRLSPGAV